MWDEDPSTIKKCRIFIPACFSLRAKNRGSESRILYYSIWNRKNGAGRSSVFPPRGILQISRGMYLYLCTHVDFFAFALRSRLVNRGQYSDMGVIFRANHSSCIRLVGGAVYEGE